MTRARLTMTDNAQIAYVAVGEGSPLVLVHGWAMSAAAFGPQIAGLSDRFRVIAPDLRGHGASDRSYDALSLDRLAQDLVELVEALDLRDVVLVGWSMGALVAWRALETGLGDRVAGLVVEDMSPKVANDADWSLGLRSGHDRAAAERSVGAMTRNWSAFTKVFAPRIFADGVAVPDRDGPLFAIAAAQDPSAMARLWLSITTADHRETLERLTTPTWVAHGARSTLYARASAQYVAARARAGRVVTFPHSGHAPHWEEPEAFNAMLCEFSEMVACGAGAAAADRLQPARQQRQ